MDAVPALGRLRLSWCSFRGLWKTISLLALWGVISGSTFLFLQWQTTEQWKSEQIHLLLDTQKTLSQTFRTYQQFLDLVEFRVSYALKKGDPDQIPLIFSQKIKAFADTDFPEIIRVHFVTTAQPHVFYSQLGKHVAKSHLPLLVQNTPPSTTCSLNDGQFESRKVLRDRSQRTLGTLQVTFSVKRLIQIPRDDFKIVPSTEGSLNDSLSFKVPGLPYIFVLNRTPPSFWRCLANGRLYLFALVLNTSISLLAGRFYGNLWLRDVYAEPIRRS